MSWDFKGENLNQKPVEQRNLGVVFQDLALFPHMSAQGNLLFAGEARGQSRARSKKQIQEFAEVLKIEGLLPRRVGQLSGGERQRVALARALMGSIKFLFLDEPFSSLDASHREFSRSLVQRTVERYNIPTLLVTHDEEDVKTLADKVVHIKKGKLEE